MIKFSLCEPSCAIANGIWHIRRLTKVGQKLGGGIDTPSLCGHVKTKQGWDLETEICQELFNKRWICKGCWEEYQKIKEVMSQDDEIKKLRELLLCAVEVITIHEHQCPHLMFPEWNHPDGGCKKKCQEAYYPGCWIDYFEDVGRNKAKYNIARWKMAII